MSESEAAREVRLYNQDIEADRQFQEALHGNEPYEIVKALASKATAAHEAWVHSGLSAEAYTDFDSIQ